MVAEIKGSESGVVSGAAQRPAALEAQTGKGPERAADKTGTPDSVSLTQTASQMHKLEQAVKASSGVDSAKVDHIRQSIANGTYHIDNQKIADKLAGFETMMQTGKGN